VIDALTGERDRLLQLMRAKDAEVWDLEKEIENKTRVIAGMEEKAKSKGKKKECIDCLNKQGDIELLKAKVDRVSY
jgi:hypothetical protein